LVASWRLELVGSYDVRIRQANREDAYASQFMRDDVRAEVDAAVGKRRVELQAMTLDEIGREFEFQFRIRPDLQTGKDNLIERILAKVRAVLERNS
jgi:hypothetical protein